MLNLTPHAVTVRTPDGNVTFPPSGTVARVEMDERRAGRLPVDGPTTLAREEPNPVLFVTVITRSPREITGLPTDASRPVLVSSMVLDAMARAGGYEQYPSYAPDTGPTAMRDDQGRIVAVTRLVAL